MAGMNGASFEMGRLIGEMLQLQRQTIYILDRQTEVLEDIRDTQLQSMRTDTQVSASPPPGTTLQDLTHLVKALYPVILLMGAIAKRMIFPEADPLIQEVIRVWHVIASGG